MTDDELTDAWEAGIVFPSGITHAEHVRIAWVLHRRHSPEEALARLLEGTHQACIAHGCGEKFDVMLTRRWSAAIAEAAAEDSADDGDSFLRWHPELLRADLFLGTVESAAAQAAPSEAGAGRAASPG